MSCRRLKLLSDDGKAALRYVDRSRRRRRRWRPELRRDKDGCLFVQRPSSFPQLELQTASNVLRRCEQIASSDSSILLYSDVSCEQGRASPYDVTCDVCHWDGLLTRLPGWHEGASDVLQQGPGNAGAPFFWSRAAIRDPSPAAAPRDGKCRPFLWRAASLTARTAARHAAREGDGSRLSDRDARCPFFCLLQRQRPCPGSSREGILGAPLMLHVAANDSPGLQGHCLPPKFNVHGSAIPHINRTGPPTSSPFFDLPSGSHPPATREPPRPDRSCFAAPATSLLVAARSANFFFFNFLVFPGQILRSRP